MCLKNKVHLFSYLILSGFFFTLTFSLWDQLARCKRGEMEEMNSRTVSAVYFLFFELFDFKFIFSSQSAWRIHKR